MITGLLAEMSKSFAHAEREPAYLTVYLVDDPDNYMYDSIVFALEKSAKTHSKACAITWKRISSFRSVRMNDIEICF
jgi:hypothetical protein